eukprot:10439259-Lingulodinium_polyedra.AAC.1
MPPDQIRRRGSPGCGWRRPFPGRLVPSTGGPWPAGAARKATRAPPPGRQRVCTVRVDGRWARHEHQPRRWAQARAARVRAALPRPSAGPAATVAVMRAAAARGRVGLPPARCVAAGVGR